MDAAWLSSNMASGNIPNLWMTTVMVLDGAGRPEVAGGHHVLRHLPLRKRRAEGRLRQAKFAPALR